MIINPMIFYWINFIDNLGGLCTGALVTAVISTIAAFIGFAFRYDEGKDTSFCKKWVKHSVIVGIIAAIFMVVIPSKETCTKMLIASQVTTDNIELVEGEIQKATDYVIDKITEVKQ